jgi:MoaA/NifB/PqqE/SkfB family radical SAM enzyme
VFSWQTKTNIALGYLTKRRPFYVQYYILSRCNLNCRQCNIVEGNSDLKEADLATVRKIAVNLRKIGAGVVLLTGGEPFLRRDLPEIVRILIGEGLNPRLQTAGFSTTREQLEACARAGAKDINISLDSLVPARQEYINGSIPRSWHRAVEAIVNANDVFSDADRICAFGTVLSKFNYREIPAIIELATFLGWWESLVPVHITSHAQPLNFRSIDTDFKFTFPDDKPALDALKARIRGMKDEGFNVFDSHAYLESAFYFLEHNRPNWRKDDICDSPSLYFAILPNGDFGVCCDHRFQGRLSVAAEDFPELYRSREFRDAVFPTVKACSGCNYGSYPEVTLSVRDRRAFLSRVMTVLFAKRRTIPRRTLAEVHDYIAHLRERYRIPDWSGPVFKPKAGALSQRYGDPQVVTRGPRTLPGRFATQREQIGPAPPDSPSPAR